MPNKANLVKVIEKVNVVKPLSEHLFGKGHKPIHRMALGFIIAVLGTAIVKAHWDFHLVQLVCESIGCLVQAIGVTPFVDSVVRMVADDVQ